MAATSLSTLLTQCAKKPQIDPAKKGTQHIPTYCDVCFWKCGAMATVVDGVLTKIEGNEKDPISNGRLCPRGTGGIGAHSDKDRLTHPLMRVGEKGEDKWKKVSWDEALTFIAKKMHESGYSLNELHDILMLEVFPVCIANLHSVAGEWAGFDENWVIENILLAKRPNRFRRWMNRRSYWMIKDDWEAVVGRFKKL